MIENKLINFEKINIKKNLISNKYCHNFSYNYTDDSP